MAVESGSKLRALQTLRALPSRHRGFRNLASPSSGAIGRLGQLRQGGEEGGRLAHEQACPCQEINCTHRRSLGLRRPNDGADGELAVEEDRWLRHDEVGLEGLTAKGRRIQVWKH